MTEATKPIVTTVAFSSVDRAAFDVFWQDIRTRYKFCEDDTGVPTQADMFAEQEAIDDILAASIDKYDMEEAIGRVAGCGDLPALLAEYGIQERSPC